MENPFQAWEDILVDAFLEEVQVLAAAVQGILDNAFEENLGQGHVIVEVEEGHLRLDHPELGQVPRGVGVLRPEGGAECVNLSQRTGEDFCLELSADGQICRAMEEIFGEIDRSARRRCLGQVESGDLEHLSRPLAIAGGDDGGVDIEKSLFLEEIVNGAADAVAQASDGAEGVGAWPKMGDGPQELEGMSFFLHGIGFRVGPAVNGDGFGQHFRDLTLGGGLADLAVDSDAAAGGQLLDLAIVIGQRAVRHHLQVALAGAVIDLQETEASLGIAARADPALHANGLAYGILVPGLGHADPVHAILPKYSSGGFIIL